MTVASTATPLELPSTIAGLWSLCALATITTRDAYEPAADLCNKLAVRRLTTVQREYFRELLALVEDYEDEHQEGEQAHSELRQLAKR